MTKSQLCAAGVTLAAVAAMLVPLRSGPAEMQTRHAGFIPIFASGGVAETKAFRRLATAGPENASSAPQVRAPASTKAHASIPNPPAAPLPHDFSSPRLRWTHLTGALRADLDALIAQHTGWKSIELHGSPATAERQINRVQRLVRGSNSHPYHLLLTADGIIARTPATTAGVLHLCFTGDSPSATQLAALDEILDYLSIKLGNLPLRAHSCLGTTFPAP
ncbi:MAG: hypothetical protein JNG86_01350 [Verrucomicrobiaceae bacterium]|nr:hypothetical protein [Verrucomicrobiaceae bacterium]